ncbi:pentapeptide repeat-containing protein [Nocardia brasiliensis]|uniref:pentapeptide repeat-containing protein n=1 Tax=Nocardia brasiliensis TaxID=37326 RepID=UPI00366FE2C9
MRLPDTKTSSTLVTWLIGVVAAAIAGATVWVSGDADIVMAILWAATIGVIAVMLAVGLRAWGQDQRVRVFSTAIGQLGSENPLVRAGAVYDLDRLLPDWDPMGRRHVLGMYTAILAHADYAGRGQQSPGPEIIAVFDSLRRHRRILEHSDRLSWPGVRLPGVDLHELYLAGVVLDSADLTDVDARDANLAGASLAGVTLIGANLTGADLSGADLTGSRLINTNLTGANLTDANLSEVTLTGANLTDTNLTRADLRTIRGHTPTSWPPPPASIPACYPNPDAGRALCGPLRQ